MMLRTLKSLPGLMGATIDLAFLGYNLQIPDSRPLGFGLGLDRLMAVTTQVRMVIILRLEVLAVLELRPDALLH